MPLSDDEKNVSSRISRKKFAQEDWDYLTAADLPNYDAPPSSHLMNGVGYTADSYKTLHGTEYIANCVCWKIHIESGAPQYEVNIARHHDYWRVDRQSNMISLEYKKRQLEGTLKDGDKDETFHSPWASGYSTRILTKAGNSIIIGGGWTHIQGSFEDEEAARDELFLASFQDLD